VPVGAGGQVSGKLHHGDFSGMANDGVNWRMPRQDRMGCKRRRRSANRQVTAKPQFSEAMREREAANDGRGVRNGEPHEGYLRRGELCGDAVDVAGPIQGVDRDRESGAHEGGGNVAKAEVLVARKLEADQRNTKGVARSISHRPMYQKTRARVTRRVVRRRTWAAIVTGSAVLEPRHR
jgi:hypothetical protein